MSELISIVIPVYNKEPYLADCFDSLRQQTYEDIEVILVDDGSTDGSADVCRKYVEMDSRFHYIHQENGGQNSARQKGAENASGDYLIFVDADDYVSHDMCRLLMENMKKTNADMVCGAIQKTKNGKLLNIIRAREGTYTPEYVFENFYVDKGSIVRKSGRYYANVFLCAKLYRRKVALNALNRVDMRIRNGEDMCLLFTAMLSASKLCFISNIIYYIRVVNDSVSHQIGTEHIKQQNRYVWKYIKNLFQETGHWPEYENILMGLILDGFVVQSLDVFDDFHGVFPFFEGDRTGRVVMYGAGDFGNNFYQKVKGLNIVGWFDKNYAIYQNRGFPVKSPDEMSNIKFDYVLITVAKETVASEIMKELRRTLPEGTRIYAISPDILNSDYTRRKIRALLDE